MIIPRVDEAAWQKHLARITPWAPPHRSILLIAPHPDDEILTVGGLAASQRFRGVEVVVAAVTDGENAYGNSPGLGELRRAEQTTALAELGISEGKIVRLGLPDGRVALHEEELFSRLSSHITRDTHVLAPWRGDIHPDHEACGRAAERVANQKGALLTSYLFWIWHRGDPDSLAGLTLGSFALDRDLLIAKTRALNHHRSQLARQGEAPILSEELLSPARRPYEVFVIHGS